MDTLSGHFISPLSLNVGTRRTCSRHGDLQCLGLKIWA
jgi:hypothetical protein